MSYPLPDPPLDDGTVRLRPWAEADAAALAAAWAEEELRRWTAVPADPSEDHARRWIRGAELRRQQGVALDLVVSPSGGDDVLGEVGLVTMAGGPARAEVGWWTAAAHRRQGVATRAVTLFAGWCRDVLQIELFAEVDSDNPASIWVAESSGVRIRLAR